MGMGGTAVAADGGPQGCSCHACWANRGRWFCAGAVYCCVGAGALLLPLLYFFLVSPVGHKDMCFATL